MKRFWKWFTREHFSWLDLIVIIIIAQILTDIMSHVVWK